MTTAISSRSRDGSAVDVLVSVVAMFGTACIVASSGTAWQAIHAKPLEFASFFGLTLALQLMAYVDYGRGSIAVSGIGFLAVGFSFGVGAAMATAAVTALVHALRARGRVHRAIFTSASFAVSAGAGALAYGVTSTPSSSTLLRLGPAILAGIVQWAVNIGLLSMAMAFAEETDVLQVWRDRFRWLTPHYVSFGPLALAASLAYEKLGLTGLVAFALPPALLIVSTRQYLQRTREALDELKVANDELERRNQDLHELYEFAGGLAAQAHDRDGLVRYAETILTRMTGERVRIATSLGEPGGHTLVAGGHPLGSVHVPESERWTSLRDAVLPQLATALESAELVERLRKTHLETIAALSRSMEAKDYYTGGHTERVATVAVALAGKLGYESADLDAIEIGALLHDIGKIGIPERILHKPGPLDDEEWKVMKEHPVISDYILSEIDLNPIVCQIARSSHERIDGQGYPDGLAGEQIPLAARIVLVADAFDALTSDRPYRRGRRVRAAVEELRAHSGTQFCPTVIDALDRLYREEPHVLASGEHRALTAA